MARLFAKDGKHLLAGFATIAAVSLAVAAWAPPSEAASGSALTPFRVAMVNSLDTEPYFYAKAKGYYKDVGLDVTFSTADSGPAVITGVLNGTFDAAATSAFPALIAIAKGVPIKIHPSTDLVAPGHGNSALVVKAGSSIKGYADLAGKTVATNALTSLTTLGLKIGLKHAGVDPDSVRIVALPFKTSVQAVARGEADAAVVISPFGTIAENNGLKVIGDPIGKMLPEGSPFTVIIASTKNSKAKAREFAAFSKATKKAVNILKADESLQRKLAQTEIGLNAAVAKQVPLPDYSTAPLDLKAFQKYADDVAEFGYSKKPVDVSKVVVSP